MFSNDPYPPVVAVVINADKKDVYVPVTAVGSIKENITLNSSLNEIIEYKTKDDDMKLIESVLDKQIVDNTDKKIKRVNDIEISTADMEYRLIGVGIGLKGALKRLGVDRIISGIGVKIPEEYLAWTDIDISKSNDVNLKLKKPYSQVKTLHPTDLANIIQDLDEKDLSTILNSLDEDIAASVLEEISSGRQVCLLDGMDNKRTANILNVMSPDSATDLFGCLSEDRANELLDLMNPKEADEIRKLLNYPPDTAGGIMTTEFAVYHEECTVREILDHLENIVKNVRFIYYIYFVSNETLTGIASLKDIIFADPDQKASEFMTIHLITVNELENDMDAALKIAKYNLLAIPVVNDKIEIKGIITVDDAISIILRLNGR